ncbi:SNF1-interacting protein [Physocladia obscura]|uniref:SNF1-interacting protein n=1 Tax=Physocladia obscura TaxID=109957 RepID=A0AAD5T6K2_9FUNG|nr:SNF1-interacting protein [Physocladia obscura]
MNDHSINLVTSFTSHRRLSILVLDSFADALKTECSLNAQMAEDLLENLVYPLQHYLREEIKELRVGDFVLNLKIINSLQEHRKNHDRVTTNYDAALAKYAQLPKNKEASALHEDSFILFEAKKAYIHSNLNYADHVISFKNKMIYFFVQQLMLGMYTHMDYFENNYEVFHGMKPSMDNLKIRIEERKHALPTQEEILSYKNALEEEALSIARPKLDNNPSVSGNIPTLSKIGLNGNSQSQPPGSKFSNTAVGNTPFSLGPSSIPMNQTATEMEGYLFRKSDKKVWTRRYFILKNCSLFYATTYPTGKLRGVVLSTDSLNLINYFTRVDIIEDRRFCFEVYGDKRSIKLQAESEREMYDWMNAIDAAKTAFLKPNSVGLPQVQYPLGWDSGSSSLQPPFYTNNEAQSPALANALAEHPQYVEDGLVAAANQALENSDDEEEDEEVVNYEVEEVGEDVAPDSDKPAAVFLDVDVVYGDKVLESRNKELHKLLKSVPQSDYVIDAFAIFLQRANLIQGKIYVTQNRICFYSNIMGIVSVLVIHLKEITNVSRTRHGLYKCINIETTKAPVE